MYILYVRRERVKIGKFTEIKYRTVSTIALYKVQEYNSIALFKIII